MEGALLLNELTAFGGNSEMWTCYICVLRGRSLALYSLILQDGTGRIAGAGVKLRSVLARRRDPNTGQLRTARHLRVASVEEVT